MMIAHTPYRSVKYRLLPGDRAAEMRLTGLRGITWNALKEAREIQHSHACGRRIASPTDVTLGTP